MGFLSLQSVEHFSQHTPEAIFTGFIILVEKGCVPFEGTHVILEEVDRMEATKNCQIYDPRLL